MKKFILFILCATASFGLFAQDSNPLFVINGKQVTMGNSSPFSIIRAEDIANITVVKDQAALIRYGNAGRSGVIEITLKEGIELISYDRLLDSFHIKAADKALPAFMDKYYIRDKQRFYTLEKQVKNVSVVDSGSQKFIRISMAEPSMLNIRGKNYDNYYLVNGIKADADCIDFIDPAAVRSMAYLNDDEARKVYGKEKWSNVVIYLNNDSCFEPRGYFYDKFHIADNARDWPLFYAGTDKELNADAFFAMPSMVRNIQVNEKEMRVDIFSNEQPAQTEALKQRIQNLTMKHENNRQIRICTISRHALLQQYVKK